MIPQAQNVICREKISYHLAKKYNSKCLLHQDFSYNILDKFIKENQQTQNLQEKYILINITPRSFDKNSLDKIKNFCDTYPKHKKIFFPCDINDDMQYFMHMKTHIQDLEIYNWTKHSLNETLQLFYDSDG